MGHLNGSIDFSFSKWAIWHFRLVCDQKWAILQTLNHREIKKLGLFECCGSEWKGRETKVNCRKCGQEVIPTGFEELEERWFGHFECSTQEFGWDGKPCGRKWKSSWTWTIDQESTDPAKIFKPWSPDLDWISTEYCGPFWAMSPWSPAIDNQIQTTQCKTCKASTFPYKLVSCMHLCITSN